MERCVDHCSPCSDAEGLSVVYVHALMPVAGWLSSKPSSLPSAPPEILRQEEKSVRRRCGGPPTERGGKEKEIKEEEEEEDMRGKDTSEGKKGKRGVTKRKGDYFSFPLGLRESRVMRARKGKM